MKRRKALKVLGFIPSILFISCEKKEFSRATIVTGKVIDENGDPMAGVPFIMYGSNGSFLAPGVQTFSISGETNKSGQYLFSQHVPRKTDVIILLMSANEMISPLETHRVYLEKDGAFSAIDYSDFNIPRDTWGETTTLNFKYEKI